MLRKSILPSHFLITVLLAAALTHSAQNLTVREIMAEPSIAGMRVEGEKLSPDGSKVVFLWNAEGKLPRDLYLSSTGQADAKVILRVSDLPKPTASPTPESKLTYGLTVRDDFVKARENALGNFEWSPDSKKLLFTQGGDIYVLTLGPTISAEEKNARWNSLVTVLRQRSPLVRRLIAALESAITDTEIVPLLKKHQKDLEVSMQSGGEWESQRQITLQIDQRIRMVVDRFFLLALPDKLKLDDAFT